MQRDEVIKVLAVLAGPLGPPVEPMADLETRQNFQDHWIDTGGVDLLNVIIDLIASPPPPEQIPLHPLHAESFSMLLEEIALILGKRYPDVARPRLQPLLDDERTRPTALDILEQLQR